MLNKLKLCSLSHKSCGAQNAQHAILSTQGLNGHPHGRFVALREIIEGSHEKYTKSDYYIIRLGEL